MSKRAGSDSRREEALRATQREMSKGLVVLVIGTTVGTLAVGAWLDYPPEVFVGGVFGSIGAFLAAPWVAIRRFEDRLRGETSGPLSVLSGFPWMLVGAGAFMILFGIIFSGSAWMLPWWFVGGGFLSFALKNMLFSAYDLGFEASRREQPASASTKDP